MKIEDLNTKIFLTDREFEELFGGDIARLVGIMNETAAGVCPSCHGYCCKNIGCVLYSEKFSTCPIYEIRPRECRYHFCNEVFRLAPLTEEEKDMMQRPVEELVTGDRGEVARLFFLFPDFPLEEAGPFGKWVRPHIDRVMVDFLSNRIDEDAAFEVIRQLCLGYADGV